MHKIRSTKTYCSAAVYAGTCSKARCVLVDASSSSEATKSGSSEVQGDREDDDYECFCRTGVKVCIECSNCKAWYHTSCLEVEDQMFSFVLNAFEFMKFIIDDIHVHVFYIMPFVSLQFCISVDGFY